MKRIIFALLIAVMTIANIAVGVVLVGDIRLMEFPETTVAVDIVEVTTDELVLQVDVTIDNPNEFSLKIEKLKIITSTLDGTELDRFTLSGGTIAGHTNRTFSDIDHISIMGEFPSKIQSKITGDTAIVFFGFIQKSMDLTMTVITSVDKVLNTLALPSLTVNTNIEEITQSGVNITGDITIHNPNTFDISIANVSIDMKTNTGDLVGFIDLTSGIIRAQENLKLQINGTIRIEALNADTLIVTMSGDAGVHLVGTHKILSLETTAEIKMPDLNDLFPSDILSDVSIGVDFRGTLRGLLGEIVLQTINPYKLSLEVTDIELLVYRLDGTDSELIASAPIEDGVLQAQNTTIQRGEILIPYKGLYFHNGKIGLPDLMKITVQANVTIPGLDHTMWVGLTGYQDVYLFR
jgi:LEA14-like dessication related protein